MTDVFEKSEELVGRMTKMIDAIRAAGDIDADYKELHVMAQLSVVKANEVCVERNQQLAAIDAKEVQLAQAHRETIAAQHRECLQMTLTEMRRHHSAIEAEVRIGFAALLAATGERGR
jgi:hypothetical protein